MLKFTKVLVVIAAVILALVVIASGYTYWTGQAAPMDTLNVSAEQPRAEVFEKFFEAVTLDKATYATGERPIIRWDMKQSNGDFIVKVLDTSRDIFISTTLATPLGETSGSEFRLPTATGDYQAWLYIVEQDQEILVATLPFSVAK